MRRLREGAPLARGAEVAPLDHAQALCPGLVAVVFGEANLAADADGNIFRRIKVLQALHRDSRAPAVEAPWEVLVAAVPHEDALWVGFEVVTDSNNRLHARNGLFCALCSRSISFFTIYFLSAQRLDLIECLQRCCYGSLPPQECLQRHIRWFL